VARRHPIDRNRIFVTGLSAGGAMAAILAEQAPDVFAAVGIMAGVRLHASHDLRSARTAMGGGSDPAGATVRGLPSSAYGRMRATVWSGAHDHTVNPSNAEALAHQFLDLFAVARVAEDRRTVGDADVVRWSDTRGLVRVETWSIRGMGHAWSGGSFRGSHTFPRGPEASDAMMRFFLETGAEDA
jgi:poly(3-hydroxybutyrate) depolymerase